MMDEEDPSPEPESDLSSVYVAQYRRHLAQVKVHLSGDDGESLPPSYIPPTGYWSSSEKAAFFHALCIYSRLRPDLIADCIKTKTVVDVCAYIDLLGEAASGDQSRQARTVRRELEGAIEVSDSWVEWEEKQAGALIAIEPTWEDETVEREREEEMSAKEALLHGGEMDEEEQACLREEFETWECEKEAQWKKGRALRCLDLHRLKVMDGMLRASEYGPAGVTIAPHGEHLASQPILSGTSTPTLAINDEMIDPTLRALSPNPQPILQPLQTGSSFQYPLHLNSSIPQAPPSAAFQTQHSLPSPPPFCPPSALVVNAEPGREPDPISSNLSPTSRRRFQKRLYMRRKRAELRGEEVNAECTKLKPGRKVQEREPKSRSKKFKAKVRPDVEEEGGETSMVIDVAMGSGSGIAGGPNRDGICSTDVDGNVARNAILNAMPSPRPNPDRISSQEQEEAQEETKRRKKYSKPGKTKPYKIREEFAKLGIDAETLRASDLGLFHLSAVGRFMKLYKSCYGATTPKASLTSISPDTIQLLNAIVVDFTTEVVHRAIISREQEFKLKGKIKVWRLTNQHEIMVANVEHALEMMGVVTWSKEKYFENLVDNEEKFTGQYEGEGQGGEEERGTVDSGDQEEDGQGEDDDNSSPEDEQTSFLALHRELHVPLIRLPPDLSPPPPVRSSLSMEPALMPMETDEDALLDELEEELELDQRDKILAHKYERELWVEVSSPIVDDDSG